MSCLTPAQIRGARGMLNWSMAQLSAAARVSVSTIMRFESEGDQFVSTESIALMRDALETEGVRFLPDDGDGPGVRMRTP